MSSPEAQHKVAARRRCLGEIERNEGRKEGRKERRKFTTALFLARGQKVPRGGEGGWEGGREGEVGGTAHSF